MLDLTQLLRVPHVDSGLKFDISPDGQRLVFAWNKTGRWELYEMLAFCIAIGIFLSTILRKRKLLKISVNILICIIVIAEFTFPIVFE